MREAGFTPTLVLVPVSWRLVGALELTLPHNRGGDAEPPAWVPESARSSFIGAAEGVPVFDVRRIEDERIYVVDATRFATFREWTISDEAQGLSVEIAAYDAGAARELAQASPDLYRTDERVTAEARAREIQKTVRVHALEPFEVEVREPQAARWLDLPAEFRRE